MRHPCDALRMKYVGDRWRVDFLGGYSCMVQLLEHPYSSVCTNFYRGSQARNMSEGAFKWLGRFILLSFVPNIGDTRWGKCVGRRDWGEVEWHRWKRFQIGFLEKTPMCSSRRDSGLELRGSPDRSFTFSSYIRSFGLKDEDGRRRFLYDDTWFE